MSRPGTVRVEVLDLQGNPIKGLSREDSIPMKMEESLDHIMQFEGGGDLSQLADQPVKLRFYIQGAKLYSFWTE